MINSDSAPEQMVRKSKREAQVRRRVLDLLAPVATDAQLSKLLHDDSIKSEEWHDMAFYLVSCGHIALVKTLLHSRKVPMRVVDSQQRTLMHLAVARNQLDLAKWLMKEANGPYGDHQLQGWWLTATTNKGLSAMEIAVKSSFMELVSLLLDEMHVFFPEHRETLDRTLRLGNEQANGWIMTQYRLQEVEKLMYGLKSLESLKERVSHLDWWQDQVNKGWTPMEKGQLYTLMSHQAKYGRGDVIDWVLTYARVSVLPPPIIEWNGMMLADKCHSGFSLTNWLLDAEESIAYELKRAEKAVDIGVPRAEVNSNGYGLKRTGESLGLTRTDGAPKPLKVKCFEDVMDHTGLLFFSRCVKNWNGKLSSLTSTLSRVFEDDKNKKYLKNPWYKMCLQKKWEQALAVIQVLAKRYDSEGPLCLPRLDLLVLTGQMNIVRWLHDHKYLDLNEIASHYLVAIEEPTPEEDKPSEEANDICALCLCSKRNREELPCGHSFCSSCVGHLKRLLEPSRCALCPRSEAIPRHSSVIDQMVYNLNMEHSWFKFDLSMPLKEILVGFAAGTGSVFILDWLIREHGVDPRPLRFGGETVMHLALTRCHLVVVTYLCFNNLGDLAEVPNKKGVTSIDKVLRGDSACAADAIETFEKAKLLPDGWIDRAMACSSKLVQEVARHRKMYNELYRVGDILKQGAAYDLVVKILTEGFTHNTTDKDSDLMQQLMLSIVENKRFDVMQWMVHNVKRTEFYDRGLLDKFCSLAEQICGDDPEFLKRVESLEAEETASHALNRVANRIRCYLMQGFPVQKIVDALEEYQVAKERALAVCSSWDSLCLFDIHAPLIDGLTPLENAIKNNYVDILDWLLNTYLEDPVSALKKINHRRTIVYTTVNTIHLLIEWLESRGASLDILLSWESFNLLQAMIACFTFAIAEVENPFAKTKRQLRENPLYRIVKPESVFAVLEYVATLPRVREIVRQQQSRGESSVLFNFFLLGGNCQCPPEKVSYVSNCIKTIVQLLVEGGCDLSLAKGTRREGKKTFLEAMVSEGHPMFLDTIRYAVLDCGLSVQFLQWKTDIFCRTEVNPWDEDAAHQFAEIQHQEKARQNRLLE